MDSIYQWLDRNHKDAEKLCVFIAWSVVMVNLFNQFSIWMMS